MTLKSRSLETNDSDLVLSDPYLQQRSDLAAFRQVNIIDQEMQAKAFKKKQHNKYMSQKYRLRKRQECDDLKE